LGEFFQRAARGGRADHDDKNESTAPAVHDR